MGKYLSLKTTSNKMSDSAIRIMEDLSTEIRVNTDQPKYFYQKAGFFKYFSNCGICNCFSWFNVSGRYSPKIHISPFCSSTSFFSLKITTAIPRRISLTLVIFHVEISTYTKHAEPSPSGLLCQ